MSQTLRFYRFCRECGSLSKGVCWCGCQRSFVIFLEYIV
jgi:hypothetical protein